MSGKENDWLAAVTAYRTEAKELYSEYWALLQDQGRAASNLISIAATNEQAETAQWWAFDFHPRWYEVRPVMDLCSSLPLEVPAAAIAQLQLRPREFLELADGVVNKVGWSPSFATPMRAAREIAQELFWRTHRMERGLTTLVQQLGLHR